MQFKPLTLILLACLTVVVATPARAALLYSEYFPNASTATGAHMSTVGWRAHIGSGAVDNTTTDTGSSSASTIWTTRGADPAIGYGFGAVGNRNGLYWTTENGPTSLNDIARISFWTNNNTTTSSLRVAILLDNNTPGDTSDDFWLASAQGFVRNVGTAAGSSGNWVSNGEKEELTFSTAGSAWRALSFTPGSNLSLGAALTGDLPAGNVVGFGLYVDANGGSNVRFDNFEVFSVPEPSRAMLATFVLGVLALRRRRHRH